MIASSLKLLQPIEMIKHMQEFYFVASAQRVDCYTYARRAASARQSSASSLDTMWPVIQCTAVWHVAHYSLEHMVRTRKWHIGSAQIWWPVVLCTRNRLHFCQESKDVLPNACLLSMSDSNESTYICMVKFPQPKLSHNEFYWGLMIATAWALLNTVVVAVAKKPACDHILVWALICMTSMCWLYLLCMECATVGRLHTVSGRMYKKN